MIPVSPTVKLIILMILVGAIAALKEAGALNPALSWTGTAVQVLAALELYLTTPPAAAEKIRALQKVQS